MTVTQPLARVLETHRLQTPLQRARGVIGREPGPDEAYVFEYDTVNERLVHMVGVREPLRVQWFVDGECKRTEQLAPWTGWAVHRCDTVVERGVPTDA